MRTRWIIQISISRPACAPPSTSWRRFGQRAKRRPRPTRLVLRPVAVERQFLVSHAEDRRCGVLRHEGVLRRNGAGLRGNGISKRKNGDGRQNDKASHWYSPCFVTRSSCGDEFKG